MCFFRHRDKQYTADVGHFEAINLTMALSPVVIIIRMFVGLTLARIQSESVMPNCFRFAVM